MSDPTPADSGADRPQPTRGGVRASMLALVAARLIAKGDPVGRSLHRLLLWGLAAVVLGMGPIIAGYSSLWLAGLGAVGSMVLLAAIALRYLSPALAVSVVGVALSCASLMTALSVTTGFEREITRAMARFNGHILLTKYGLDFFEYGELSDRFIADPRVTAASPFAYSMVAVVGDVSPDDLDADPRLADYEVAQPAEDDISPEPAVVVGKGMDPARAAALDGITDVIRGGDLSGLRPGDSRHPPGIVLGHRLAAEVGAEIGELVRVVVPAELDGDSGAVSKPPRHATFEVLDLIETGTTEFDRNLAIMHITAAQALFFKEGRVTGIEFELTDPTLASTVAGEMEAQLPPFYRTSTWEETGSAMLLGLRQIRATLSVVLGLMMLVAASSLIASLLLLVRRKRHDIAVMMTVGADRGAVFWVFEIVGMTIGVAGAILGLCLGALYCLLIQRYHFPLTSDVYPVDHLPVVVRAVDALGPAAAAVALCALASGPVAVLAASVRPLEGLKR